MFYCFFFQVFDDVWRNFVFGTEVWGRTDQFFPGFEERQRGDELQRNHLADDLIGIERRIFAAKQCQSADKDPQLAEKPVGLSFCDAVITTDRFQTFKGFWVNFVCGISIFVEDEEMEQVLLFVGETDQPQPEFLKRRRIVVHIGDIV